MASFNLLWANLAAQLEATIMFPVWRIQLTE